MLFRSGEDAYAFVGMVSFGAKSACRRRSTRSTADIDVEVNAGAAVVIGPEKGETGR